MSVSKKQLDKAGDTLRVAPDDTFSLQQLSNWRANHVKPLALAFKLVKKYTNEIGNNAIYGQRLKRISSILYKLNRNPDMKMSRMQDIGGCRIILSDYKKVFDLYELLKKSRVILPNDKNYIHYPKEDGYRSIHLIYQCSSKDYAGLKIEIQLRTKLQHAWATTVEIIDTFEEQNLKLGGGTDDWKEFFRLVSDEFAIIEKLPLIDRNFEQHRARLIQLANDLDVIHKLRSYTETVFLSESSHMATHAEFTILELNVKEKSGKLILFDDLQSAQDEYLRLETQYLNNNQFNILMLRMADIKQIKESYPNYFADSVKFIQILEKLLKK